MPVRVDVMTYNVRYDNPREETYVWRKRRDEVASVIRFHDPDVVGLQEALHDQLRDLADRLPDYEWLPAGRADGESENAGEYAAVGFDKTRFNVEETGTFWLSETPEEPGSLGWDARLPRLVKHVRLRDRDTDVEFYHFNTHFDHYGAAAKVESARLLRERIDAITDVEPVLVTGDVNACDDEEPYEILTRVEGYERTLFDTHFAASHGHHGPTSSVTDFRSLVPGKKIDYVFVSNDVEVATHGTCSDTYGDGRYPSDHLPVFASVSLPQRSPVDR